MRSGPGGLMAAINTRTLSPQSLYLSAAALHAVATTTSVRVRDGKMLVLDCSVAETKAPRTDF